MEELERLRRRIRNARDLQSVVKMMKMISAANVRQYGQAVESLMEYNRTIEMGLQIVMMNRSKELLSNGPAQKKKQLGAVIFGSDQGLVGNFNELIASFALEKMKGIDHEEQMALAVGERIIPRLEKLGQPVEAYFSFFAGRPGITPVMLDLLVKIEEWRLDKGVDQILLFYNRPVSAGSFRPFMAYLYPLDMKWLEGLGKKKWPSRSLPTFTMDIEQLFSSLIRQYIFFSLYRAFVESLASENTGRLLAMQMAEKNINEHLSDLNLQFHRQRQEAISAELLDIVTGFEALTGGERKE